MTILTQASTQWMSRPADQRFTSLNDLNDHCTYARKTSVGKVLSSRQIEARPVDGTRDGMQVVGPNGGPVEVTHWSFGQLAQRAGAPAGYLRGLPSPIAADCINYGLRFKRDVEDVGVLLHKNGGPAELRAVTGPNYGRVWNSTITQSLVGLFGDGVNGHWRVPGEFGKRVDVTKDNTTLYASDRDMFVFLADEDRRIEVPNRRDGKSGAMARGFFVWNSEVGSTSFGFAGFCSITPAATASCGVCRTSRKSASVTPRAPRIVGWRKSRRLSRHMPRVQRRVCSRRFRLPSSRSSTMSMPSCATVSAALR